jgi:hypothetical protein
MFEIRENDEVIEPDKFFMDMRDYDDNEGHFDITHRKLFNIYTKSIFILGKKILTLKKIRTDLPYDTEVGNKEFLKIRNREKIINGLI